ncbi:hypothetical protein AJ78_00205 [Emergomyces pasteurianus Ep9510]|uniref:BZIP domain-containing protein n=1 Tax=Emergomyces pasteurianus Ep9510 TaxID=1447872 RepID=A0A1J9QX03_9EURO|nr:hypothetical protein AJ78_00205 [Emergomyces pasteurianus Ep9510]
MAPKRQRRKTNDPAVPDISDDAEERKRILNVLAQRRYRKRKREHLAALEAKVQKDDQEEQGSTTIDLLSTEYSAENQSGFDNVPPSEETENFAPNVPPASPGTIHRVQEALLDTLNGVDSSSACSNFFSESEIPNFVPELVMNDSSSSSPSSIATMPSPSSFEALFSLAPSSPELEAFSYQFLQNPISEQDLAPNDLSATLQSHQTTTFTFPDDHTIEIPTLSLLRAILTIADRLQLTALIWSMDAVSPFYTGPTGLKSPSFSSSSSSSATAASWDNLPAHLQPTPTQRLIPHHPILDLLPWPVTRDKLIQVFSMPAELRPASASHPMALMNLVYDIEDPSEGVRVSGGDPFQLDMWEVGQIVFERWWWAFETRVIEMSNRWRRSRGQQGLVIGTSS